MNLVALTWLSTPRGAGRRREEEKLGWTLECGTEGKPGRKKFLKSQLKRNREV